ncbi:hypothetical protein HPB50_017932 [Hyalomma asiaticum]|uniref:Uncharacterized protein n=1 Tax=Hyalomma asiaticum TaxID=266040 RepID=A0ACB7T593_HYAAI|nr:hypothetical protein HPB50_017932 [Hyalomma asiaticum]
MDDIRKVKEKIEQLDELRYRGALVRARAEDTAAGEMPSKRALCLEKARAESNHINAVEWGAVGAVVRGAVADARPGEIGPPRAKWQLPRSSYAATTLRRWRGPLFPPPDKANRTASGDGPAAVSPVGNMNAPATRSTECKGHDAVSTKWKPRPMLKPASDDYVIVIKPRERISLLEAFTETGYGTAISAYLGPERARAISVLPSRDQNIIIVHTPDIEAADRLIGDFVVNTEKGKVLLQGYLRKDGGNTCQGVIVVRNTDTTATLQHRVCWRDGNIVEIRKFGTSNKARITFAGKEKPRYVHYDNMVVPVRNYYKATPACGLCGAVGHRADACPNLPPNTCELCGLHAPLVQGVRAPHGCVPRCSVCSGAHATNSRDCAAKFRTPKTAARKGGKKKMAPKKKSRHPGLPRDQPRRKPSKTDKSAPPPGGGNRLSTASPPQGGPEKPTAETRGRTGAWVTAVENGHQGSGSGGAAASSLLLTPRARSAEQAEIAALRAQNEMLLKKIIALESKINQIPPSPSIPAAEVMESELVAPNAATSAEAAFESRFDARFGAIDAQFAAIENQISVMLTAMSKLQETIPAMIAQQCAQTSRPSRRLAGPYKDLSGHSVKTSRRTTEAEDDDSCSLSGIEELPLPASAGSRVAPFFNMPGATTNASTYFQRRYGSADKPSLN